MRRAWYWSFLICLAIVNVSCDEDDCPTCVACDGNCCVDTSALQSQLAQANHDLQKAKDDLNATQKALDKCRDTGEECIPCDGKNCPDTSALQSQLTQAKRELRAAQNELATTQKSLDACMSKTHQGNNCPGTEKLQNELNDIRQKLNTTKEALALTNAELATTRTELANTKDALATANADLITTRTELETSQNNLESCHKDLKVLQAKPKSKSGSRLKLLAYEGEDGSLSIQTGTYYDTLLKTECSAYNNMYCNDDSIYCIPRELNWALNANKQYPSYIFCSDAYSSDESIITYGSYFKSNIASSVSEIIADGRTYFANSNCTSAIEPKYGKIQYVADDDCLYNKDTVFFNTQSVLTSNSTDSRICIDGSKYEKTNPKYNAITSYYKPIDSTFHSIYYLNSNGKCEVYKKGNIILLKEIDKKEISLDIARANRRTYCESYCAALKAEAEAAGWAKIKRVQLDVE